MGIFSAVGGFFGNITLYVQAFLKLIGLIKDINNAVKDVQENNRRKDFKEGVDHKDTTKIEDSFDSPNAGKPDKIGDIEWDDEKPK